MRQSISSSLSYSKIKFIKGFSRSMMGLKVLHGRMGGWVDGLVIIMPPAWPQLIN